MVACQEREMESAYDDVDGIRIVVSRGEHRDVIGGLWDQLGQLQFDYMIREGLKPHHKLLDIGCGSLRGGIHFIRYLDAGNYIGTDPNMSLLDAGYEIELGSSGVKERMPRENLICTGDFELPFPDGAFDFALAQSVFTHVSLNTIRKCFERIASKIKVGGAFYATFFEIPDDVLCSEPFRHDPGYGRRGISGAGTIREVNTSRPLYGKTIRSASQTEASELYRSTKLDRCQAAPTITARMLVPRIASIL